MLEVSVFFFCLIINRTSSMSCFSHKRKSTLISRSKAQQWIINLLAKLLIDINNIREGKINKCQRGTQNRHVGNKTFMYEQEKPKQTFSARTKKVALPTFAYELFLKKFPHSFSSYSILMFIRKNSLMVHRFSYRKNGMEIVIFRITLNTRNFTFSTIFFSQNY